MPNQMKKVLIVDDSPRAVTRLRDLYMKLGWDVRGTARNGVEALQILENETFDLISLDIIMPVMDGIETFHAIQKRKFPGICFFVSVLAAEQRVVDVYASLVPASRMLSKSLSDEALLVALKRIDPEVGSIPHAAGEINPSAQRLAQDGMDSMGATDN
jgi:CheY-like chemotaxis protein